MTTTDIGPQTPIADVDAYLANTGFELVVRRGRANDKQTVTVILKAVNPRPSFISTKPTFWEALADAVNRAALAASKSPNPQRR